MIQTCKCQPLVYICNILFTSNHFYYAIMTKKVTSSQVKLTLYNENYSIRKYRILEFLNNLPAKQAAQLKKSIPNELNISRQTFSKWLNASIYDGLEISAVALLKIALTLNISPLELVNFPIYPIKTQSKPRQSQFDALKSKVTT